MFTGIVEEVGRIAALQSKSLVIAASKVLGRVELGGSIAVNGVCLTITNFNTGSFWVDVMTETIKRTNLRLLSAGDGVNLELPLALDRPLGGHLVQGHIDTTGRVISITWDDETMMMKFAAPPEVMRYIVNQGFIAVDGVSLTVVTKDANSFWVSLVDYTRRHTTLGSRQTGDLVNLEIDIMAKYAEQFGQPVHRGITAEFLQEHGYIT